MGKPASNTELLLLPFVESGYYLIDSQGAIWRRKGAGRVRAENKSSTGYLQVRKVVNGTRINAGAHRLVWVANFGPIKDGHEINHINGKKADNCPSNLEQVTGSENMKHAHKTGLRDQRGAKNPASKLSAKDVANIRRLYAAGGVTQAELGNKYGVSFKTISKIVRGDRRVVDAGPVADYTSRRAVNKRRVREFPR